MEWKKIAKVFLRILWMLRLVTPPEGNPCPPRPRKKKDGADDKPPAAGMLMISKNVSDVIAAEHVGATNCSKLLPRSQVLYSLQWDCRRSTRKINLLVLHCSDTRPDQDFTIEKLITSHRAKGYGAYPGYHLYVRRDGTLFYCRPVAERGCHVKGFNTNSIGICYEGGHSSNPEAKYEDNRTAEQMVAIDEVLRILHEIYPDARIVGHCELNPRKACPCLNPPASQEYAYIFH